MTNILLTGAGFTRNWGGWLANEAFEYVLGRPEVSVELRQRLWADKRRHRGFEDTLGDIQQEAARGVPRAAEMVDGFMAALVAMFDAMNKGLATAKFEADVEPDLQVARFLARFDYIFTVNQDLLLELHYVHPDQPTQLRRDRKISLMPGTKLLHPPAPHGGSLMNRMGATRTPDVDGPLIFQPQPVAQPYVKLHGSSNWMRAGGETPLLVLGGGKEILIQRDPLLSQYHAEFASVLRRPGTKFMVIGYSFGDDHVNNAIGAAADAGDLSVFIVDPLGVDVLDKWRDRPNNIPGPQPFFEKVLLSLKGASRRPLSATFGHDRVEHGKLVSFLETS